MNDRDIEDTRQPPDEIEAVDCEFCGQEMEEDDHVTEDSWWYCKNPFCPEKWTSEIVHDMAEKLVEVLAENHILKARNNYLELAMERKWNATKK